MQRKISTIYRSFKTKDSEKLWNIHLRGTDEHFFRKADLEGKGYRKHTHKFSFLYKSLVMMTGPGGGVGMKSTTWPSPSSCWTQSFHKGRRLLVKNAEIWGQYLPGFYGIKSQHQEYLWPWGDVRELIQSLIQPTSPGGGLSMAVIQGPAPPVQ